MDNSDNQWIENFLQGDEQGFSQLVKKYLSPIYNFLARFTSDQEAADDLTQETFIKAWKNLRHFDVSKDFKVWIYTIAKNTAYDFLKKKKIIPFSFFEDEKGNTPFDFISDDNLLPNEFLEKEELGKELEEKLNEISSTYRMILLMYYKDGFSLAEIAEILHKPYNTIKSQHQRALQSLKKRFEKE